MPKVQHLTCRVNISNSFLVDVETLDFILVYCKRDLKDFLNHLPLLLTADKVLHIFEKGKLLLLSKYCDLITRRQDLFADPLFLEYHQVNGIDSYMKLMTITDLEMHFIL